MRKTDIIEILPLLHNLDIKKLKDKKEKGLTRYQFLKILNIGTGKNQYEKIEELIDMGFIEQVNDNPPQFDINKYEIWEFWKKTPIGEECMEMIEDNKFVL